MYFLNHYSAPLLLLVLFAGAASFAWRGKARVRRLIVVTVALAAMGLAGWFARPVEERLRTGEGPTLLELQSPYCLACLAVKPKVDQLQKELGTKLSVRRVNIQSAEGKQMSKEYGIERTPTFLFFDAEGAEQWRTEGGFDAERVRSSLSN